METKKGLTGKEKFAYGIGAVGKDMVYMLSASYILYYFQDIMKTSAIAMGVILLVARVFDAFNDPIMGVVVAKTKTKWGKFRPWLLIGTVTNAVILFLMFVSAVVNCFVILSALLAVSDVPIAVTAITVKIVTRAEPTPAHERARAERPSLSLPPSVNAGIIDQ